MQATVGNWTGRIKRQLHDPYHMGRWTGTQYSLNESQFLYIITLYRVGKGENIGVTSSYTQQRLALQQRFGLQNNQTPRLQVLLDLQEYIQSLEISSMDMLIIMTDANETLGEDPYGIQEVMAKFHLIDIFTKHHNQDCTVASHKQSEGRRIDYIVGSSNVLPYIERCGYLPFNKGIDSDHRGLFLDLHPSIVGNHIHIRSPPQRKIGYTTCKKEVFQYKNEILAQFHEHNIVERTQTLYDAADATLEDNTDFTHELNAVDSEITRIMLEAEQKCCTKKPPFKWTPEVHNASLVIKYWKVKYRSRKHKFDISAQLQKIYDQLTEESQIAIDISTTSALSNLRRAKSAKMELYRLYHEQRRENMDKHLTDEARYLGVDKEILEKQRRHRTQEDRMFHYLKSVYPKLRGTGSPAQGLTEPTDR